jgi:hypothetical protein
VQTVERVHKLDTALNGINRLEGSSPLPSQNKTNEMYLVLSGKESTPDKYGESEIQTISFVNLVTKVRGLFRMFPKFVYK